ncbi:hypothetical protein [Streptomyces sp. HNM0574]|uniref:hypothetical protein n=1 Tax=Streptomyces sp. HNM0574 TaxID=2714954 RepID=UPI0019D2D260|nr:hypothetical protein [Streptomyces sp. HNM0574]
MSKQVAFRPTEEDARILGEQQAEGESQSDVLRRALRLLEQKAWTEKAHLDMYRLKREDLSDEPDDWGYGPEGEIVDLRGSEAHRRFSSLPPGAQ